MTTDTNMEKHKEWISTVYAVSEEFLSPMQSWMDCIFQFEDDMVIVLPALERIVQAYEELSDRLDNDIQAYLFPETIISKNSEPTLIGFSALEKSIIYTLMDVWNEFEEVMAKLVDEVHDSMSYRESHNIWSLGLVPCNFRDNIRDVSMVLTKVKILWEFVFGYEGCLMKKVRAELMRIKNNQMETS